jgi:glycosyltransferase involved in cell wall biosynthesis
MTYEDIKLKIENLIFDNSEKEKMLKLYESITSEKFSWKKNARETEKIYSKIL